MSVHKLNPDHGSTSAPLSVGLSFQQDLYDLADTVIATRAIRALDQSACRYPIHRLVRCATTRDFVLVLDDLALHAGLDAVRPDQHSLLLDGVGVFVQVRARRKADYCSFEFNVWSDTVVRASATRDRLLELVGQQLDRNGMFTIDWNFMNSNSNLVNVSFDELADAALLDEAYPALGEPVAGFIDRYLNARETVLVLQGPPGTGKTRLVRSILSAISRRKGEAAKIMYTSDKRALEQDEIFVDFITGSHEAFVIEDADHLLKARSSGNQDLHRFLNIADGVVRSQGRKIIFTTNLPNITDIDDALLRPGRCFASVRARLLGRDDARRLLARLSDDARRCEAALESLFACGAKGVSVASVYQQLNGQLRL
jgi:hypothetical protein